MPKGSIFLLFMSIVSLSATPSWAGKGPKPGDLPAFDADFACTAQEAATRYQRDFSIDLASFGGNELCRSEIDTKKFYNDLQLVEEGRFGGSATNVFIKNFVDRDRYYPWLASMTYGVRRGHDVPWATAYNSGGQFTMQDGWTKLSTLGRVGTVIHEARHTEGYSHRACRQGPYSNTNLPGCDQSVGEGGSHGVEMEYYARVALQGVNFHPAYQAMARLMALGRANFVFNQLPMVRQEPLLALTQDQALLVTPQETLQASLPPHQGFALKRTSFGATFFNGSEAIALDLYGQDTEAYPLADDFSYFKIIQMPQHVPAVDIEEFDVTTRRFLVSLDAQGNLRNFVFKDAQWSRPVQVRGAARLVTVAPNGSTGLFVIKTDGKLCSFDASRMSCTDLNGVMWPTDTKAFAHFGTTLVQLKSSGQVLEAISGQAFAPLQNAAIDQFTTVPVYDSFEL
ncbi:MAG: hypothetical protein IT288_00025 [Bdellovibrionales bacterium]|nr:hypothetical protein [Bdellovibrionales bacterium]